MPKRKWKDVKNYEGLYQVSNLGEVFECILDASEKYNIHHSNKLQRSWNKHGEDIFDIQILKICTNYT